MNFLIIGAGAIGSLVGGRLALAGHTVTLVGRAGFAAMLRESGLWLQDTMGRHHVTDIYATDGINSAFTATSPLYDLAIVTVKSYDTHTALQELTQAISESGASVPALLSLQNGVGNEDAIASAFPNAKVLAGTITTPVSVPETGVVQVDKPNNTIGVSKWRSDVSDVAGVPDELLSNVVRALSQAGFDVHVYSHAQGMKWTKLLMNMLGNATSAILDRPPQDVFADRRLVDIEIGAWKEAMKVMRASDIPAVNLGSYPFAVLASILRILPHPVLRTLLRQRIGAARGGKMPSLHIDLERGRQKSEVGWLNGAVVQQGRKCGINTPVNRTLTEVLTALVQDPNQRAGWRHNNERLLAAVEEDRTG